MRFRAARSIPAMARRRALARCRGIDVGRGRGDLPGARRGPGARLLGDRGARAPRGERRPARVRRGRPRTRSCDAAVREGIERCRKSLMAGEAAFAELIAREGWYCDLRPLRYLSHFITPTSSPIRFTARFFLGRLPHGPGAAAVHRGDVGGILDLPGRGLPALPVGRDEDGRAGRVRPRLSGAVRLGSRSCGRPRRRSPQVPGHRRSDGRRSGRASTGSRTGFRA